MNYRIHKINTENYPQFDDMIYWRMTGNERLPSEEIISQNILDELSNPNLLIYAVEVEGKYVGWISLVYIPKVGKFNGHGHIYVDELWIHPSYRGNGLAYALMKKVEIVIKEMGATGSRLYVNTDNPNAKKLYEKCGFRIVSLSYFMER